MENFEALRTEIELQLDQWLPDCSGPLRAEMSHVCALSDYVRQQLVRDIDMIKALINSGELEQSYSASHYQSQLKNLILEDLDAGLRQCRQRAMTRIIFRDLTRRATLEETTADLSHLADACIATSLRVHYAKNCQKFGLPIGAESGEVQQMAVLALGKLGACELNVSSDIDLIFLYDESGMVKSATSELTNQEFFVRTSRDIIRSLDANLANGFVFRVDMRLRPYGESGALILNRSAMEKYFYEQGRDWERYAFVKARVAAGDLKFGQQFLSWLKPFIYRKHLDYGAIESLREMKHMINAQVASKDMLDDVKLGPGGIREVEFIIQALQLIWGGRESRLQERQILNAMTLIAAGDFLPTEEVRQLREAYCFLRNSEHVIQAEKDRQTQRLPSTMLSQQRLSIAMGYSNYPEYYLALTSYRDNVTAIFSRFMSSNNAEGESSKTDRLFWAKIWREPEMEDGLDILTEYGFLRANEVVKNLQDLSRRMKVHDMQEIGIERLDRLMPIVMSFAAREKDPDQTLARLLPIIEQIARRSTYIVYLLENMDALKRMTNLCGMSSWVADHLAEMPILLYELSDRQTHEAVFDKTQLARELREQIATAEVNDLELQMDLLRQFKTGAVLKVAVLELSDMLPLMKASDALTTIAEVVLDQAVELAWQSMVERFGEPCDSDNVPQGCRLAIIAYGKLGGFELGYGSDLDLVMLVDVDQQGVTNGVKSIDNGVFFHRLAQRVIHILTRYTRFGTVYEIDLRLRPSGNKGPLVSTFGAYARYLQEVAWTWEHQALVRSRFVAGHPALRVKFDDLRAEILQRPRDRAQLLHEVVSMREKMRVHLDSESAEATARRRGGLESESGDAVLVSGFDLKHGAGAIVDIEFMVQFWVLALSHEHPEVARWSDKVRLLEALEVIGVFSAADQKLLHEAYLAYRSAVHYQWLGGEMSSFKQLNQYRDGVVDIWQRCMTQPTV